MSGTLGTAHYQPPWNRIRLPRYTTCRKRDPRKRHDMSTGDRHPITGPFASAASAGLLFQERRGRSLGIARSDIVPHGVEVSV